MNGHCAFGTMTSPVTSDVATSGEGDDGSWNNHGGGGSSSVLENSRTTSGRRKQRKPQRNNGK